METGAQRDERTERYPTVRNYSIIEKSRMIWNWIVDAVLRHALYSLSTGPLPRHIAFIMDGIGGGLDRTACLSRKDMLKDSKH